MNESSRREAEILSAALERPPAERAAFLEQVCAGDVKLHRQVEALIQAHESASGFMEEPPTHFHLTSTARVELPPVQQPGDTIGRYKLLQQIGEGGCGIVYMAEQETPVRRRVALKVIKLGMDTKEVIARFEAERQALALMDHPNIAKVFDAGATETGRPYFVMELVRGVKITEFCDEHRLSTEERLKLFMQVCHAIQHAHQKGVIHRDIKPSNILVTINDGVPVPKVIDFGIAKATAGRLTDQTLFTAFEQFIGTPAYMSPEQAVMTSLDIDTRSDIYSLGVLLYELLVGKTPFEARELMQAGFDEMRRMIRDQEPPRPSTRLNMMIGDELTTTATRRRTEPPTLVNVLSGDLDWIVMKCLEKDRTRRYETASGLARDMERYMGNEPVTARPPHRWYRLRKAIRRNKATFAATSLILMVLLVGVVVSTWQAIRATRAEQKQNSLRKQAEAHEERARRSAEKSEQVARFLKDMLKGVGPSVALGRDTAMLREILDNTAARLAAELTNQPEVEIELRSSLTQVYTDLQSYKEMEENARKELELARTHFGSESLPVADALVRLGNALMYSRKMDEAERITRQAIALERSLRGPGSAQEGAALVNLGDVLRHQSELQQEPSKLVLAEAALREGLAIREKQLGDSEEVVWTLYTLATLLDKQKRTEEAMAASAQALAMIRRLYGDEHPVTGAALSQSGRLLIKSTRVDEGLKAMRRGLEIMQRTQGAGKNYAQARIEAGLGEALLKQGEMEEAEIHYRNAVTIARREVGANSPDLPELLIKFGRFLRQKGELNEASAIARDAAAICQATELQIPPRIHREATNLLDAILKDVAKANALQDKAVPTGAPR